MELQYPQNAPPTFALQSVHLWCILSLNHNIRSTRTARSGQKGEKTVYYSTNRKFNWHVLVLPFLLIFLLSFTAIAVSQFNNDQKIEIDTSRLAEYGMVRLRCSESLALWETEEEGWIEVTELETEWSERATVWPGEWSYITLTEGSGKYTFSLRGANQDENASPAGKRCLEVTGLEPMRSVSDFENVQLIFDSSRGVWARRIYDKTETGWDEVIMIQKEKENTQEYHYALNETGKWELLPITEGNGSYTINVSYGSDLLETGHSSRQVGGTVNINLSDPDIAFLAPSTVIDYSEDSLCAAKAAQLTQELESDQEKIDTIVNYVADLLTYSEEIRMERRQMPNYTFRHYDADQIFLRETGTCGDYAALTTAMLRSQGIPCKYVRGPFTNLNGEISDHAWVEVQTGEGQWTRIDPTGVDSIRDAEDKNVQKQIEEALREDDRYQADQYV